MTSPPFSFLLNVCLACQGGGQVQAIRRLRPQLVSVEVLVSVGRATGQPLTDPALVFQIAPLSSAITVACWAKSSIGEALLTQREIRHLGLAAAPSLVSDWHPFAHDVCGLGESDGGSGIEALAELTKPRPPRIQGFLH